MRTWSIARRVSRAFTLTVAVLALVTSITSSFLLGASVERELAALSKEELDEMRVLLEASPGTLDDLHGIGARLAREHSNALAWRLWEGDRLLADAGSARLLERLPRVPESGEAAIPEDVVWAQAELADGRRLVSLVDAVPQRQLLARYRLLVFALAATMILVALGVGSWLGGHLSRMVEGVARELRGIDHLGTETPTGDPRAPEEVREVAAALAELLARLRAEQERAWLLAQGLAHELRSPVQTLLNQGEVTLLRPRTGEEYQRVLASQVEELEDLARVVDNLVTLVRPGASSGQASEPFDLGSEARLRLEKTRQEAQRHGVRLDLELDGPLELEGDREALLLALKNLAGNAIEWSPPGGRVLVRLEGHADHVDMRVEDAGPGIPEAERDRVFEPFYRGPRPSGGAGRVGYGLGLALTRSAVGAHGGSISVGTSGLGGAAFRIRLPRPGARPRPGSLSGSAARSREPGRAGDGAGSRARSTPRSPGP